MSKFVLLIAAVSCFLINCYTNRDAKKTIVYSDKIENENYIILRDPTKLPNWPNYYEVMKKGFAKSDGSTSDTSFGPSLYRGGGPWDSSGDGKGIYLDIDPGNRYVLVFVGAIALGKENFDSPRFGCILVKDKALSQTNELLISRDDIYKVFQPGIYDVFGFKNGGLILKNTFYVAYLK